MGGADSRVSRFYDRWATPYDLLASHGPGLSRFRRRCVDALELAGGDTVVDMGAGSGANLQYLHDAVGPDGRVYCLDVSAGQLERAQRRAVEHDWKNVGVCRGDAARPPFEPGTDGDQLRPDAIVATFVVGMLDRPARVVDRWCDLVGADGRIGLLYARRSTRSAAAPLNGLCRLFVRLAAPNERFARESPVRSLEDRGRRATRALDARCDELRSESLAGGFLRLVAGRVTD